MGRRLQALRPRLDPTHRPLEHLGRGGDQVVLWIGADLAAEAATDVVRDDPHLRLSHAQSARNKQTDEVRVLRPHPDGQLIVERAVLGHDATRLDGGRRQALLQDPLFDNDLGLGKSVFDRILRRIRQIPGEVVDLFRVGLGAIGFQGRHDVDDGRQWLVLDFDRFRPIDRQLAVFGHHNGDWLALEHCLVVGYGKSRRHCVLFSDERGGDRVRAAQDCLEVGGGEHRDDS